MAQLKTKIVLRNDDMTAWEASNPTLSKGEVALAKREDGSYDLRIGNDTSEWKDLSGSFAISSDQVIGLDKELEKIHVPQVYTELNVDTTKGLDVIISESAALSAQTFGPGDMLVLKDAKSVASAYQYDKEDGWIACDGNVDASKVIIDSDITITQAFGKHGINSALGYGEIPCAGWNMKQLIAESFSNTKSAGKTNPSISWTSSPGNFGTVEAGTWLTGGNADNAITMKYTDGGWTEYNGSTKSGNRVIKSNITATRIALQDEDFDGNVFNLDAINKSYSYDASTDALSVLEPNKDLTLIGAISNADLSVQATDSEISLYKWSVSAPYEAGTVTPVNNLGSADEGNKIAGGTFTKSETTVKVPAGSRYYFWGYLTDGNQYDITKDSDGKVTGCNITSDQIRAFMSKKDGANRAQYGTAFPSTTNKSTNFTVGANTKQIIFAAPAGKVNKKIKVYNNSNLGAGLDFDNANAKYANAFKVAGANGYSPIDYDMWCVTFGAAFSTAANLAISWE